MLNRRVWVLVGLCALLAPSPAFARGGHGGGGHGGGGHGGGGRGGGGHGGHSGGHGSHGSGPHSSVGLAAGPHVGGGNRGGRSNAPGGRIYLWVPPPFVTTGGVLMRCSGIDIGAGAAQDLVLQACGAPGSTRQAVYATHDGERVVEVWSYAFSSSSTRTLRFEDGVLTAIDSVGPLNR